MISLSAVCSLAFVFGTFFLLAGNSLESTIEEPKKDEKVKISKRERGEGGRF